MKKLNEFKGNKKCASIIVSALFCGMSLATIAATPGANFNGVVKEIFTNGTSILVNVDGVVSVQCTGGWGPYNLTFDLSDVGGKEKYELIRDAFLANRPISGTVLGCGSSNINKIKQVSTFSQD